jgi:hypothetical protein
MVGAPFHHGPMWRYGENLVHHHFSPHHIMVGRLYAILAWMLFHLFLSSGKRRGRRQLPLSLETTQSLFKLPIFFLSQLLVHTYLQIKNARSFLICTIWNLSNSIKNVWCEQNLPLYSLVKHLELIIWRKFFLGKFAPWGNFVLFF